MSTDDEDTPPPMDPASVLSRLLPAARHEETHLSHVFITRTDVYKLKKTIRLPFCDFRSVGKRHAACLKEVEVNRPLAAPLYKGVIPLTRRGNTYEIDGDGAVIDWLVHMAPFREEGRADIALGKGRVTALDLRHLVDRLYLQHERTEKTRDDDWRGRLLGITDNVSRGLLGQVSGRELRKAVLVWRRQLKQRINRLHSLLDRRGKLSVLTKCHGDLHLKNICLWEGQLIAYDALEFDDSFIRIDRLYDLAFLVADLWHHGHPDHANAVMNRYISLEGDYDSVQLMPVYCALRAGIRGMAAAMSGKTEEASAYLATALSFLAPADDAGCLVISGRSGTGKTTIASALAPTIPPPPGALHIRSDVLRKRRHGLMPEEALGEGAYSPAESPAESRAVYEACLDTARRLKGSWPVILDIAFASRVEEVRPALEELGAVKVWLTAPDHVLVQRLNARRHDASDATSDVMKGQRLEAPSPGWHVMDASGDTEAMIAALRNHHGKPRALHRSHPDYLPSHEV